MIDFLQTIGGCLTLALFLVILVALARASARPVTRETVTPAAPDDRIEFGGHFERVATYQGTVKTGEFIRHSWPSPLCTFCGARQREAGKCETCEARQ